VVKAGNLFQAQLNGFCILIFSIMLFFLLMVMFIMVYITFSRSIVRYMGHSKRPVETGAFILRGLALFLMRFPSMYLLYFRGSQAQPDIVVKVVGRQWYWRFEVMDLHEDPVLMYMLPLDELLVGERVYLEVDNRLVLPSGMRVQFNVTSSDVIHRFAMPTLGVKVDATPGLLTVVRADIMKVGTHYGQCSEICGMNHRFMPFVIEIVPMPAFVAWVDLGLLEDMRVRPPSPPVPPVPPIEPPSPPVDPHWYERLLGKVKRVGQHSWRKFDHEVIDPLSKWGLWDWVCLTPIVAGLYLLWWLWDHGFFD